MGLVFAMGLAMLSDLRSSMRSKDWACGFWYRNRLVLGQTPRAVGLALGMAFRRGDGTLGDAIAKFRGFSVVTAGLYPALISAVSALDMEY